MKLATHTFSKIAVLAISALLFGAGAATAAVVDYVGYGWETGGLSASAPGDELSVATVVTQIDPLFGVDLGAVEATLFIEGLSSQGAVVNNMNGTTTISYTGGTIAIYAGADRNHDWGVNPANGTVPSTFTDGDLVFSGAFTSFILIMQSSGLGVFEGYIDGTGGSALAGPCTGCAYTFAGSFTLPTGAQIPSGYDMQIDGVLEVESAVGTETVNFGTLKQFFNQGR